MSLFQVKSIVVLEALGKCYIGSVVEHIYYYELQSIDDEMIRSLISSFVIKCGILLGFANERYLLSTASGLTNPNWTDHGVPLMDIIKSRPALTVKTK